MYAIRSYYELVKHELECVGGMDSAEHIDERHLPAARRLFELAFDVGYDAGAGRSNDGSHPEPYGDFL